MAALAVARLPSGAASHSLRGFFPPLSPVSLSAPEGALDAGRKYEEPVIGLTGGGDV